LVIDAPRTTVSAGLFRPVAIVSRDVVAALSEEQMEAAILHEKSHAKSHDNLKRLAILLAPAVFPLARIEAAWRKFAEWAADDLAVAGDRARSVALAEALVRVARIGRPQQMALATSLLGDNFSARVERLVNGSVPAEAPRWKLALFVCSS